jgi:hypothetical protein
MADSSPSRLRCTLNDLRDFRWPPKYLRRRERHANRGLESWAQKLTHKGVKASAAPEVSVIFLFSTIPAHSSHKETRIQRFAHDRQSVHPICQNHYCFL